MCKPDCRSYTFTPLNKKNSAHSAFDDNLRFQHAQNDPISGNLNTIAL